ncbi:MAG: hypothetical protein V5A27_05400 [Halapricum sp.]
MECSRCGGDLETYTLDGNEAYVCAECGFVDTPVEHEATPRPEPEPWEEALKRFHEKYVEGDVAITGTGETAALVELESEEPDVADDASGESADEDSKSEGVDESSDSDEKPTDDGSEPEAPPESDDEAAEATADDDSDSEDTTESKTDEQEKPV